MSDSDLARRERALGIVWSTEFEVTRDATFEWGDGTDYPPSAEWRPSKTRASVMLVRGRSNLHQLVASLSQDARGGEGLRRLALARCQRWSRVAMAVARPVVDGSLARIPAVFGQHHAGNAIIVPGILYGIGPRWIYAFEVGPRWLVVSMEGEALPVSTCGRCPACAPLFRPHRRALA